MAKMRHSKRQIIHARGKALRNVRTVNDLLARDDIAAMLEDVLRDKANASALVVIFMDRQGNVSVSHAGLHWLAAAGLCDMGKAMILNLEED